MNCFLSRRLTVYSTAVLLSFLTASSGVAGTWIEQTFEDFADGRLDAAGQNLYVGRDGKIRTIHRFDLNQDGHVDLVFNSTHNTSTFIPATSARVSSTGEISQQPLAVEGSRQVALADLNRDGHLDAVFCPNAGGVQDGRRFLTILWGGTDGWPAHRSNGGLPVHRAQRIVVADLNADSWPDIVVLNGAAWLRGQPAGDILRIYWGDESGFLLSRRLDLGVDGAVDLAAGDLNGDGADDLAVLTTRQAIELFWAERSEQLPKNVVRSRVGLSKKGASCLTLGDTDNDGHLDLIVGTNQDSIIIFPGSGGRQLGRESHVRAAAASQVTVGDLDGDRRADLVLTNFSRRRAAGGEAGSADPLAGKYLVVLWGHQSGFSLKNSRQLPITNATAAAIGDLNGDTRPDLAVAVYQGTQSFSTDSVIFFGAGKRQFQRSRSRLKTTGAIDVAVAPAEGNLPARAVFCNSLSGRLREEVPLHIYWGGPKGFSPKNVWKLPFASGYESSAADLNRDGYVDLIELNSGHSGVAGELNPDLGVNIFWGSVDGFDIKKQRTVLSEEYLGTSNVADLNRDGYLDLILGQFFASKGAPTTELLICYGGANGFDRKQRVGIPSPGRSISTVVADFNQDDWLDVAVNSYEKDLVRIFWGSRNGFDSKRQARISIINPIDLETADLNGDGHLDLIASSYHDRLTGLHDLGSTLLWGGKQGFKTSNAQWLPGFTPIGHCVADFDRDGYLDIFSPHYHGNGTRESMPCYLYWGSQTGFATRRRTTLVCDSAHDALAADFNRDGKLDLAVVCHTQNGSHYSDAKIFYNDGNRFADPKVTKLPTHGPHWMWQQDMGHISHRRWEQKYESSVFAFSKPATKGKLSFRAELPTGTKLTFAVRSADKQSRLSDKPWQPVPSDRFELHSQDRFLQYSATFQSDNGDRYPVLDRVQIDLE